MSIKINVRSPYFIKVEDNLLSSVNFDLYVWNGNSNASPSTPTYSFSKSVVSTNKYIMFEVADYVRDHIETEYSNYATSSVWVQWVYQMVDAAGSNIGSAITSAPYLAVDGYGFFEEGINPDLARDLLQSNTDIYYHDGQDVVFSVFSEDVQSVSMTSSGAPEVKWEDVALYWENDSALWESGSTAQTITDSIDSGNKIQYVRITETENLNDGDTVTITKRASAGGGTIILTLKKICEQKYSTYKAIFYNKFGAMQDFTFFKKSSKTLSISSDTFKRNIIDVSNVSGPSYNTASHQIKAFNINGNEKITLNTGFYPEDFNEILEQLMLSEEVWLDNGQIVLPVRPVSGSLAYKTSVNDKLISYSLDFEYAYDKINSIR